jgi:hypothetical protein
MTAMANLFERLGQQQLAEIPKTEPREPITVPRGPLLQPIVPPTNYSSPLIERLLDWLINRWTKPSVRVRDICQFGPRPVRNRKTATTLAETLVEHGWLTPLNTHRYDKREWKIIRGPSGG